MSRVVRWTEYGVQLADGMVAPAASRDVAVGHGRGGPVCRSISLKLHPASGAATADIGPWVPLAGAA